MYVWVTGYLGASTPTSTPELMERIKIDAVAVSYDSTNNKVEITITVRNIGDISVNITAGYVIDPETGTSMGNGTPTDGTVQPGGTTTVTVTPHQGVSLTSGKLYVAKVVTENGVEAATVFKAP